MNCPCGKPVRLEGQRYCRECHNAYMRRNRPKHSELPDEARKRATCRSYANVYLRRGKLERQDCESCGSEDSEMHHEDYSKPLHVNWLCRPCHLDHHKFHVET